MNLAFTFARRELRSGVSGFRIFLACLALGVAALAAAGSTAEAFRQGLAAQSRSILGGDLAISIQGRRFTPVEENAFARLGRTTKTFSVRAMAESPGGRRLAEVRGIDDAYPLAGRVELRGTRNLADATATVDGFPGAAVEAELLDRLHIKVGQTFMIGDKPFIVRAVLINEPDRLGRGFALGPGVVVAGSVLETSGLLGSDALFGETIRVALPPNAKPAAAASNLTKAFPNSGLRIRGRNEAAAGLGRLIDQLEFFLGFIGLAALLAGGLGVSSAVSTYLEARKPSIAVLKALGADGPLIRNVYLIQVSALALLGIAIGLAIGAASPFLLGWISRNRLPAPALFDLYPLPLVKAGLFGLMAAAAFSLLPLARARTTPPSSLFRRDLAGRIGFGLETIGLAIAGIGLIGLILVTAPSPLVAGVMIGGVALGFGLLWLLGQGATILASWLRRFTKGSVRIGLANLSGPRSAARTASPSIGFGVALLTAVVLIQSSLLAEVSDVAPKTAPSMVFTQIPPENVRAFDSSMAAMMGPLSPDRYRRYPFATGRITQIQGAPVDTSKIEKSQRWAFDQDVSVSTIGAAPPDADLTAGSWWPADYSGAPEVILDNDIGRAAALGIGETITVSVLGRPLEVRIVGFRKIQFSGFGASFPIILNPTALEGANLRDIAIARTSKAQETEILARLGSEFPSVNVISVREQLEAAAKIFNQLAWAVRGAAAVAALAGLLVLLGAIASTAQARAREAAVMKVLGSGRIQILAAYAVEYGVVGLIAGAAGVMLGGAAAYPIVTRVFETHFAIDWTGIVTVLVLVAAIGAAAGAIAAFSALARRPAPILRAV